MTASGLEGFRFETRFQCRSTMNGTCCKLNHMQAAKYPPANVVRKFREEVLGQVSPMSSDCGSKLRGPSLNRSCDATKREVNATKLNQTRQHQDA
ncbi:hypothetical protein AVEN_79525-1 [Araneus ventricosus]|uniref:Uncharacterized protein n=1 Tax=Araneus ventricosus TaxID=182803 RepID=A0A4Y2ENV9_ARAVE|nr:hypothetical protein AVEN_130958-1 [Araneus ventricosus]GBM30374.1 hypothetical protein AVEN_43455-1 [Araneus ventricosus]GBO22635.1 hypothetical protein AVEN_223341-1 [Araneus ventricosus]GBO22656.1 hypothetical protein AVEN_79525-1 [Araneus ventricosus]